MIVISSDSLKEKVELEKLLKMCVIALVFGINLNTILLQNTDTP